MESAPTWNSVHLEDTSSISKQVMKHSNIVKVYGGKLLLGLEFKLFKFFLFPPSKCFKVPLERTSSVLRKFYKIQVFSAPHLLLRKFFSFLGPLGPVLNACY